MEANNPFTEQVRLLVALLPSVAKQACFALKGGTAINLFLRDMPRLSVDIEPLYRAEFEDMIYEPVVLERLQETLKQLVHEIHNAMTDEDRHFLLALKQGTQDWRNFSLPEVERLPGIQWKMLNLARMNPSKRRQAEVKLEKILAK